MNWKETETTDPLKIYPFLIGFYIRYFLLLLITFLLIYSSLFAIIGKVLFF